MNKFLQYATITLVFLLTGCAVNPTPATLNEIVVTPTRVNAEPTSIPTVPLTVSAVSTSPTPKPTSSTVMTTLVPTVPPELEMAITYTCELDGTNLPVEIFEVVNQYPHSRNAYTQGLIFRDGWLYEGTGLHGRSSLRQVDLQSGNIEERVDLPDQYFGEGITELNDNIFQLTWQEYTGFVYQLDSFEITGEFTYATEGWGLTHDGSRLIMSDGTDRLYFLDPARLTVTGEVAVSDDRGPVYRINEMEFIDGQILANIYQTACIARINPQDGKVVGWIDISGLYELAVAAGSPSGEGPEIMPEVPNGIAYDAENDRLFVTGKLWPALFEIRLHPAKDQP